MVGGFKGMNAHMTVAGDLLTPAVEEIESDEEERAFNREHTHSEV